MIRLFVLVLGSGLLAGLPSAAATGNSHTKLPQAPGHAAEPYEGFRADQALLRKHIVLKARDGGKDTIASSDEACAAARRIFSRAAFLFRTRSEVLDLLGDPATVSDYNQPAVKNPSRSLVYVFDTGLGGLTYSLRFGQLDRMRVTQVQVEGRD